MDQTDPEKPQFVRETTSSMEKQWGGRNSILNCPDSVGKWSKKKNTVPQNLERSWGDERQGCAAERTHGAGRTEKGTSGGKLIKSDPVPLKMHIVVMENKGVSSHNRKKWKGGKGRAREGWGMKRGHNLRDGDGLSLQEEVRALAFQGDQDSSYMWGETLRSAPLREKWKKGKLKNEA